MKTNGKTRIMVIAAFLAIGTAGAQLWAQDWPAWSGKANADKKEWDEMGVWFADSWNYITTEYDESLKKKIGERTFNMIRTYSDAYLRSVNENVVQERDRELLSMAQQAAGFTSRNGDQKAGVKFWKKNKAAYQKALAAAQEAARLAKEKADAEKAAREQAAAEARRKAAEEQAAAEKKAEEERQAAIAAANAKGVTAEDFDYDITRDGKGILLKRYNGKATIVKIPAVIEGMPVMEIEPSVFSRKTGITSVTIPDSVTAMYPAKTGGEYMKRPSYRGTFEGCTSLSSVTLPRTLKVISDRMFYGCTSLAAIVIPNGVTEIGAEAFRNCAALASVTLSASLKDIGHFAFTDCASLAATTLPDSLIKMGIGVFMDSGLTSIVLPKNLNIMEGRFYDSEKRYTQYSGYDSEERYTQHSDYVAAGVFQDCKNLESVTIESSGLTLVRAFQGCGALTTLTINGNITIKNDDTGIPGMRDGNAFSGCSNLTTVNIGPKVTKIGGVDELLNAGKLSIATKAALAKLR